MRLKVEKLGPGLHPSEVVVAVRTESGNQQLHVDVDSLSADNTLSVGWPVGQDKGGELLLVELPGETASGTWRVWVRRDDLELHEDLPRRRATA